MLDRVLILEFCAALIGILSPISSSFQKLYGALINLLSGMASFFQQQNPPAFFTHNHFFVIFGFLQVVSPAKASSLIQSNPGIYYVAVTSLLIYLIASAIEASSSSSSSSSRLLRSAINSLRWCVFFASLILFAATASFFFQDSVRLVFFVLILIIIGACALLLWVHKIQTESRWGWWHRCQLFFINILKRLAHRFPQHQRRARPTLPLCH